MINATWRCTLFSPIHLHHDGQSVYHHIQEATNHKPQEARDNDEDG